MLSLGMTNTPDIMTTATFLSTDIISIGTQIHWFDVTDSDHGGEYGLEVTDSSCRLLDCDCNPDPDHEPTLRSIKSLLVDSLATLVVS